jgi:ubiquinone/menaquinone biosynthesis C-methylase UbiE
MRNLWFESDLACCVCKKKLLRDNDAQLYCSNECCDAGYLKNGVLYVLPKDSVLRQKYGKKFDAWLIIQKQGIRDYENEPARHLAIKGNPHEKYFEDFGEFCKLSGKVLDIGCGPSGKVPVYLQNADIVAGVDPIPGNSPKEIPFCCAMGEFLPFPKECFDNVTINTVLDHVLHPDMVIAEATRVLTPSGKLHICLSISNKNEGMIGTKIRIKGFIKKTLPPKIVSCLMTLKHGKKYVDQSHCIIPNGAADASHMEHFNESDVFSFLSRSSLEVTDFKKVRIIGSKNFIGFFSAQKRFEY